MRNLRIVAGIVALLALLVTGLIAAPAQATPVGGTYSNCFGVDSGSVMARIGVYWETNGTSPAVRPYQVWYDRAVAGGSSFGVTYFANNIQRGAVTWPQTGQTAQTHNWTGLAYGTRDRSTYVKFRLVLGGRVCTGTVYSVAG